MRIRLLHLGLAAALLGTSACELVADFDRSKLNPERPDTGTTPPDEEDAGPDASEDDAG